MYLLLICLFVFIIIALFCLILKNPFKYPYYIVKLDATGRKSPRMDVLLDEYLISTGIDDFIEAFNRVNKWKLKCKDIVANSAFKRLRSRQLKDVIDDSNLFKIEIYKNQTRYKQINYQKYPYIVNIIIDTFYCDMNYITARYDELKEINFECTLSQYNSKEQRKLMTKELRQSIMRRDNYTCQICGKYMPDEVGLHIDHIIPISKGGKSIKSNLQVLCSKCNNNKGAKIIKPLTALANIENIIMLEKADSVTKIYVRDNPKPLIRPLEDYYYYESKFLNYFRNN